jgi:hypothetical protein
MSDQTVIASLGSVAAPIRVTLSELDGTPVVDIRKYYLDRVAGTLKPTTKGITVKEENFAELLAVLGEKEAAILGWLRAKTSSDVSRLTKRASVLSQPFSVSLHVDPSMRGAGFFDCEHQGGQLSVAVNATHPFSKVVNTQSSEAGFRTSFGTV